MSRKPKRETQTLRSPSPGDTRHPLPVSWGQEVTRAKTKTLNIQTGRCYPEIFITKIFCKPKSLSCNYIQNGACFLPSSLKINSRNHAPFRSVVSTSSFSWGSIHKVWESPGCQAGAKAAQLPWPHSLTPLPKFKRK